jgi:hypothetical protein
MRASSASLAWRETGLVCHRRSAPSELLAFCPSKPHEIAVEFRQELVHLQNVVRCHGRARRGQAFAEVLGQLVSVQGQVRDVCDRGRGVVNLNGDDGHRVAAAAGAIEVHKK